MTPGKTLEEKRNPSIESSFKGFQAKDEERGRWHHHPHGVAAAEGESHKSNKSAEKESRSSCRLLPIILHSFSLLFFYCRP
jgi:hypothetical protein